MLACDRRLVSVLAHPLRVADCLMAPTADADQIALLLSGTVDVGFAQCQLRVLVHMVDVMDDNRPRVSAVRLADLALVMVGGDDLIPKVLPRCRQVKRIGHFEILQQAETGRRHAERSAGERAGGEARELSKRPPFYLCLPYGGGKERNQMPR